jgi:hypothetical protein
VQVSINFKKVFSEVRVVAYDPFCDLPFSLLRCLSEILCRYEQLLQLY